MTRTLQLKGGSTAQNNAHTGLARELTVDTTKNTVRVHNGSTAGGTELARLADVGVHIGVNPPPSPFVGQSWWDPTDGNLYIYYNDGSSIQWVSAMSVVGPPGPTGPGVNKAEFNLGSVSGTRSILIANGELQTGILTGNTSLSLPTVPAGRTEQLTIILTNNTTGGYSVVAPGVAWIGGVQPTVDPSPNAVNVLVFRGRNAGWIGDGGVAQ